MLLHRYWITFLPGTKASLLNLGCGITAASWKEAENILRDKVFSRFGEREISGVIENMDVSSLDPRHVRPKSGLFGNLVSHHLMDALRG